MNGLPPKIRSHTLRTKSKDLDDTIAIAVAKLADRKKNGKKFCSKINELCKLITTGRITR